MSRSPAPTMTNDCGIVLGATGARYIALARRAARALKQVMPGIAIDLFTDADPGDPVFDRVHAVGGPTTRPKMDALRRSRFARTLYLDCDIVAVADLSDIFDILERADIVGAHEQYGSSPVAMMTASDRPIPTGFRQINGGLIGIRKNAATDRFLETWQREFIARDLRYDQPLLREILWDSDLRLVVLPHEYNLMHMPYLMAGNDKMMAPRALHLPHLHVYDKFTARPETPLSPGEILSPPELECLTMRLSTDRTLGARRSLHTVAADLLRHAPAVERQARRALHWWRK